LYQSTQGLSGTASGKFPVAVEAMAGEPLDATDRALPGGSESRRETGALDVQKLSPVPLSGITDRSPHLDEDDNCPYMAVRARGGLGTASPTFSLRDVARHVTGSPTGPAKFPGWFSEGDEPISSLKDVTVPKFNIFPEMEKQTHAEKACKRISRYSPQVPQIEFEDFTGEVMSGFKDLDSALEEMTTADISLEGNVTHPEAAVLHSAVPIETNVADIPGDKANNPVLVPAILLDMLMDALSFQRTSATPEVLERLTNRIMVLEARVSSYETILNKAVAPRTPQRRPNTVPVSTAPLNWQVSPQRRRVALQASNVNTSRGRRQARRDLERAQAEHLSIVERIQTTTIAPATKKRMTTHPV
jgi:hypothetical protein